MKRHTALLALPTATLMALSLAACTDNLQNQKSASGDGDGDGVTVTITDDSCDVSPAEFPSGKVTFTVTNNGTKPNEFEVLAENKLQIESERENIGPGTTATLTTALDEGTYYTACKPNMVGDFVGLAELAVTKGEEVTVSDDVQAAEDEAITNYTGYVKDQVGQLVDATKEFTDAYTSGDTEKAKALFPLARQHYERIEPTAESFGVKEAGDLDGALDARVQDLSADAGKKPNDPEVLKDWTGWHRIEADLFAGKSEGFAFESEADRKKVADQLGEDTQTLYDLVYGKVDGASGKFELKLSDVATGASNLMEEVALSKIGGEEETFSHTDLYDFNANVEGAEVAYGNVEKLVEEQDPDLAKRITHNLDKVNELLEKQTDGKDDDGNVFYKDYSKVASVQKDAGEAPKDTDYTKTQQEFSDAVNALSEPLSRVSGTVLH
ncbi:MULTISPECIES: iron uptake system protein EfeO [unclassified Brevibacterium]|uniref:iron uptake system protein EfeO n=1 Tax=unclassified Brevibacterium TaxID=2614124 RepID=UPI001E366AA0|nr:MULTISPECIES: iron uptake system protein EfeO [unclassified Brevibacterium]MCD1286392.1 PbrT family lead (Pb2+) uptake porter [Brevibacterium sp. CCUG 69071]MDK8433760.1 peptidase M75 family protein [Brevibacterium sp. H-BE7]